jgi:lipoyl-dependent peroxiredoxin
VLRQFVEAVLVLSDDPAPANLERYLAASQALEDLAPSGRAVGRRSSSRPQARSHRSKGERTMTNEMTALYTAEATVTGGREGHARTSDGRLDVELDVPIEMGGPGGPGTNPEQLFAAGYAACFQSALLRVASGRKLDLSGSRITARVGIGPLKSGGFGLTAALNLDAPQIGYDEALELMSRAHESCPYSRATRGNLEVTLTAGGASFERNAA